MLTLALLAGLWSSTCIQTQINGKQGFVVESYYFEESGTFEFTREWFEDPGCQLAKSADMEAGTIHIGPRMSGMFITGETHEADFISDAGTDLGAISINNGNLKVARGYKNSSMRNTMLGIFEFKKQ